MPRPLALTPAMIGEIARRRRAGEPWKAIARDLHARGLPSGRTHLWAVWRRTRDVSEHLGPCAAPGDGATP